jgi:hypothetical protein
VRDVRNVRNVSPAQSVPGTIHIAALNVLEFLMSSPLQQRWTTQKQTGNNTKKKKAGLVEEEFERR